MIVVVIGASNNPERYSYRALRLLKDKGHEVIPVHPRLKEIDGVPVQYPISSIRTAVHTVTLYVGKARSQTMIDEILGLRPQRLIVNPGAENEELEAAARLAGVSVVRGCTLVMLNTGQF